MNLVNCSKVSLTLLPRKTNDTEEAQEARAKGDC